MSSAPAVVVRRGSVLGTLFAGIFATLIVCIVCVAGLGWYALNMADRFAGDVLLTGRSVLDSLPQLQDSIPLVGDFLNDQRAPDYREELAATARLVELQNGRPAVLIEVRNEGTQIVTLLSARVVLSDQAGVPQHEYRTYLATPLSVDDGDWRGPLLPGSTCRVTQGLCGVGAAGQVELVITDLRVWRGEPAAAPDPAEEEEA